MISELLFLMEKVSLEDGVQDIKEKEIKRLARVGINNFLKDKDII